MRVNHQLTLWLSSPVWSRPRPYDCDEIRANLFLSMTQSAALLERGHCTTPMDESSSTRNHGRI
jgi:hypothetical protein